MCRGALRRSPEGAAPRGLCEKKASHNEATGSSHGALGVRPRISESKIISRSLILISVQPSPADIWPTEVIIDLVKKRQEATGHPQAAFVISRREAGTKLRDHIQEVLSRFELSVWDGTRDRVSYAEAMGKGSFSPSGGTSEVRSASEGDISSEQHFIGLQGNLAFG